MNKEELNQLVDKNQTIKIVPSIEDTLCSSGLNVELDENSRLWFHQLKLSWKTWKKSTTIENHIHLFFQSIPDPYRVALIFIIKCEDFKDCKSKTLPYFIIEVLQKWSQTSGIYPENTLKLPAFHISIQQRSQQFLNLMVKTYHVITIKETILPIVNNMVKNDNCKQACQIVTALELFDDIPVETILFPLILQDKTNIIDEYLSECPSQVHSLLYFLDKLLDKNFNIREYVQKYIDENNIGHIKYDKLHYKPLGKLVGRLCNKFKVPIETCKNLSKNRTTGGLRYLIHQKYVEHNVSSSVWDDLVKDSLKQNVQSAQEFIDLLIDYDRKEALKWAAYLKIPENELPHALQQMSIQDISEEDWDKDTNSPQEYYKISLPDDQIIMIDTSEKFYDMMVSDVVRCDVVSIDCEWKPSFGAKQSQVALIQIGTNNKVYLIDTLTLNKREYASFWYTFNKSLLDNAEIIKLGFGLEQDLKEIKSSVINLSNIKIKGEGLLDLCLLWKSLLISGLSLPNDTDNGGSSLSSIVQACFGLPLEKSEQRSNWEIRPLRNTQIYYAATDAFVLIEIYKYLQNLSLKQGLDFEEICNDVMLERKMKTQKKMSTADRIQTSLNNLQTKSVSEIKFLVESKLSNIIPYLRYCGINTTATPSTMLWCDMVNLAISEDRVILSSKFRGTPYVTFPQSSILDIGKGTIKDQLQRVLIYYKVSIKQSDLLSHCIKCNGKELTKMSDNEVLSICNNHPFSTNLNEKQYCEDDIQSYDDFLSDSDCDEDLYQPMTNVCQNKVFTSKGVPIEISGRQKILEKSSTKIAILCETCGKLYWDEDELLKSVKEVVTQLTNISM